MRNSSAIRQEFITSSGIAPDLYDFAVKIVPDIEIDPITKEVTETPLYDLLNWNYTRFGYQAKPNLLGATFIQETGEPWQTKIFGFFDNGNRTGKYYAPTGIGDVPYLPPVPQRIREEIATKHGLTAPHEGQSFWDWFTHNKTIPLAIDEGGKKALCTLSGGYASVSLFGCLCGAKWKDELNRLELIPQLKPLVVARKVLITMDQGDTKPKSIRAVRKGIKRLARAIKNAGGHPYVATWNSELGKGIDDVAASHGLEKVQEILENAVSFDEWLGNRVETEFLTYLASVTINKRYFDVEIPDNKLVCIKGVQSTGKTEMLVGLCAKAIEEGRPIFILSHLESLARALGERLGVPYRTERIADGRILGYSLVTDSLRPKRQGFDAEHWIGVEPLVILDECEQVIWHTLNGKTDIRQYRVKVLTQFQKLLRMASQIILADADLSDHSIQFIQGLLEEKVEPLLIVNEYQHEGWDIFTLPSILEWHSNLIKKAKAGKKLLILTAAQKPRSKNGTMAIENRILDECPWLRVLRVDKDTLAQKGHPACEGKGDFDALFKQYDVVISSPSLVSGISLELKGHFDEVWGLSTGAITPTNFVQFLWRLRENVPRFIHVNKVSNIGLIGNGSTNPSEIRRSENAKVKLTLAALREFDDLNASDIDALVNPICMKTWAKMGARTNQQMKAYRETIYGLLEAQNHRIYEGEVSLDKEGRKQERETLTNNRDHVRNHHLSKRVKAEDIDSSVAKQLEEKPLKTSSETAKLDRYKLKQKYGQVTQEIALADDDGLHPKLKLHYHLTVGRQFVEAKDTAKLQTLLEDNDGSAFIPDVNRTTKISEVRGLEVLDVLSLVDETREFVATDEDLKERALFAIHNTSEIKTLFGISVCQPTPNPKTGEMTLPTIKVARQQLNLIGYDLKRSERRTVNGKRQHIYKLVDLLPPQTRHDIFDHWLTKDREYSLVSSENIELARENESVARQTVYNISTPCAKDEGTTSVVPPPPNIEPRRDLRDSEEHQVARQTVYNISTPCAKEAVPSPEVGMEVINLATSGIGKIISVSKKLSEVLVEFADLVIPYKLSSFWDEVELAF